MKQLLLLATGLFTACGALGCASDDAGARKVGELSAELKPVVDGNNAFSIDLYSQAATHPGNLFLSPFSVAAVFALLERGADGQTKQELSSALHLSGEETAYHKQFGALMRDLGAADTGRGYELNIANALFLIDQFSPLADYMTTAQEDYSAQVEQVDFAQDQALTRINDWASAKTHGMVPKLFDKLEPRTVLVLANAIYFEARWADGFDEEDTRDEPFLVSPTESKTVPMLWREDKFSCSRDGVQMAELDYEDHELSMVLIAPESADDAGFVPLTELEANLSPERVNTLLGSLAPCHGTLLLPKFTLSSLFDLKDLLPGLGVTSAFSPEEADLSRLSADPGLYVGQAIHRAVIEVDERGTRAAAASAVTVDNQSFGRTFQFDRPFIFLIRDKLTQSILFIGRVTDPTEAAE